MKIYMIRHGQTPWNAQKRLQGRSDIDLNENGIRLARITAEALRDVPFSAAFTSPLIRARHTAELILAGRDVPVTADDRIIEISFGEYEGKCFQGEKREIDDPAFRNFFDAPQDYHTPKGGESLDEVEKRTADFMHDICSRPELEDKTILISTHGCALRGLLNSLKETPRENYWNGGVSKNCAVSIVECRNKIPVLLQENRIYYELSDENMRG